MKVYISGKISGYELDFVEKKFAESESFLKSMGLIAVNPVKVNPFSDNKTWKDYMVEDIKTLLECDAIYMQKDWEKSKGAKVEYDLAKGLGLLLMFE